MGQLSPVTHSIDSEGIAWIILDDPVARANVLNPATLAALRDCLVGLAASGKPGESTMKAVVIGSGKERIFVAGADLNWLAALPDANAATQAAREGQALFETIAQFKVPVVCAIHGACVGGGYELALACSWRLASDAPETRIGLPEVGLGLIPAWGGCTRLPRLIGLESAVRFILKAALVPAATALTAGLIDEVVPVTEWKERAKAAALRLATNGGAVRPVPAMPGAQFFSDQRTATWRCRPGQPAALAVLEVMEKSVGLPVTAALEVEALAFGPVAAGRVAKNLLHVFQLKEAARKRTLEGWFPASSESVRPAPFRTIGIIGAGVMGSGLAHWCAAYGFGVILCDAKRPAIERGVAVIRELFADSVQRGKVSGDDAHRMTGGIGITTSLEDFEFCDLVIETISDDAEDKKKLFAELSAILRPECVLASNSSVLPLDALAAMVINPERVIGLHFFNPVSRMRLVEVGLGAQTGRAAAERALGFLRTMDKIPVICRPSPGNFVMRVLAFYLNEACRLREQGVALSLIDPAMQAWGWPMGPLRVIDEIGVDVTAGIFREMTRVFPDRFVASTLCDQLLGKEWLGRKNHRSVGFYTYTEEGEAPNPGVDVFAPVSPAATAGWSAEAVQERLVGVLVNEAKRALAEGVVKTADEADLALIFGAGYPVFRGGLFHEGRG